MNLFVFEEKLYKQGFNRIAGVDEAGRGPLAGPIVAAAVILPQCVKIEGLKECKQLLPQRREDLYFQILEKAIDYKVEVYSHEEIDNKGLHNVNLAALKQAALNLKQKPDFVLVDGYKLKEMEISSLKIIKGDLVSASIAAASILAKVHRDRIMQAYDKQFPQYGFASHKGYSTKQHFNALEKHGLCPIHRKSFPILENFFQKN